MNPVDHTGKVLGKLTVIRRNGVTGKLNHIAWECLCECGNRRTYDAALIACKRVISCGCEKRQTGRTVMLGDGTFQKIMLPKNLSDAMTVLLLRSRDEDRKYKTPCRIWVGTKNGGYGHMRYNDGTTRTHRLMWQCHNGSIPEELEVCHKCDQPDCLRIDHLFLGTHLQNMLDAQEKERMGGLVGESHHSHKFTVDQVLKLRLQFDSGLKPTKLLAESMGVSYTALVKVKNRESWKSI